MYRIRLYKQATVAVFWLCVFLGVKEGAKAFAEPDQLLDVIRHPVSWGYKQAANRSIDTVIIHTIYNPETRDPFCLESILAILKKYQVAPHYLILRDGMLYQLVEPAHIAYHAGESMTPDGRVAVNNFSIGIELVNSKSKPVTIKQYKALAHLIGYLKKEYPIEGIFGHGEIASGRKTDPWNFNWAKFHEIVREYK